MPNSLLHRRSNTRTPSYGEQRYKQLIFSLLSLYAKTIWRLGGEGEVQVQIFLGWEATKFLSTCVVRLYGQQTTCCQTSLYPFPISFRLHDSMGNASSFITSFHVSTIVIIISLPEAKENYQRRVTINRTAWANYIVLTFIQTSLAYNDINYTVPSIWNPIGPKNPTFVSPERLSLVT